MSAQGPTRAEKAEQRREALEMVWGIANHANNADRFISMKTSPHSQLGVYLTIAQLLQIKLALMEH